MLKVGIKLSKGPNWKPSWSLKMDNRDHGGEKLPKYCGSQSEKLHSMQVTGSAADIFDSRSSLLLLCLTIEEALLCVTRFTTEM